MRLTFDQWAMGLAKLTAQRSTCCRRQVGCVLFNERGHVMSTGYNGVASGMPHCNDEGARTYEGWGEPTLPTYPNACPGATSQSGTNLDGCLAIHAEQNALLQCRDPYHIHSCYVTVSPCMTCVKLLMNTSCRKIVFAEEYPHQEARELWLSADGEWIHLKESIYGKT